MERVTWRIPGETLREIRVKARRRGVRDVQLVRTAIDRELGRDTGLDELAQVREEIAALREELASVRRHLQRMR